MNTMYLADNLPKNIVNLLGRMSVGIAKIKINIRPTYRKILKIKEQSSKQQNKNKQRTKVLRKRIKHG